MSGTNPYHPRIYPANYPLLDKYGPEHSAVRALQVHAEACDDCVGKEIEWPDIGNRSIDQSWFSVRRRTQQSFSAFAYEFLSYDLILDGWLEMAPEPTESEIGYMVDDQPLMRALLDECQEAADADGNVEILPLIAKAREFVDAYNDAIVRRFNDCRIPWPAQQGDVGNL
jgi:hypothetical protein